MEIRRGTTPTICIELPLEIEPENIAAAYVTMNQDGNELEKQLSDLTITDNFLSFDMTQEETLAFNSLITGSIQVRLKMADGTSLASQKEPLKFLPVMKEDVI